MTDKLLLCKKEIIKNIFEERGLLFLIDVYGYFHQRPEVIFNNLSLSMRDIRVIMKGLISENFIEKHDTIAWRLKSDR